MLTFKITATFITGQEAVHNWLPGPSLIVGKRLNKEYRNSVKNSKFYRLKPPHLSQTQNFSTLSLFLSDPCAHGVRSLGSNVRPSDMLFKPCEDLVKTVNVVNVVKI